MAVLACTVMLSFSPPLLSECGVCTLFGFILFAQLQLYCVSLILASTAQTFRWLRSITLQFCIPPLIGVCTTFAMATWYFFTAL